MKDDETTTVNVRATLAGQSLVNATPELLILMWEGWVLRYLPSSELVLHAEARPIYPGELVSTGVRVPVGQSEEVTVTATRGEQTAAVPSPQPLTTYIVTPAVRRACPERRDFFIPGPDVRDEHGQLLGQRALLQ